MRNFLSRRSAVPPPEIRAALEELEQLRQNRPVLGEHAAFLGAILPGLFEQAPRETLPTIDPEHSAAKLAGGVPLLRGEQLALEPKGLPRRWLHICAALEKQKSRDMGRKLADGMRKGQVGPQEWLTDLLAGNPQAVHERAEALNLDPALAATVFRLTVLPSLAEINTQLQPLRDAAKWERGYCPTCGSWPLLGEYRGLEQIRFLRCGLCAAEWSFPRLECPYCTTRDHHQLGYFSVEGEESKYRAATCDACRRYVKMVSTLESLDTPRLLVADLATLHLDLAAADRGYGA